MSEPGDNSSPAGEPSKPANPTANAPLQPMVNAVPATPQNPMAGSITNAPSLDPMTTPTPDASDMQQPLPLEQPQIGTIVKPQIAERWYQTVSQNLQPERLDDILSSAITGAISDQFRLFEEMEEKCLPLRTALHKHKLKIAMRKFRIVPPDQPEDDTVAKKKADFANLAWSEIRDWPRTLYNALDMVGKNISVHEIDYAIRPVRGQMSVLINKMPWVNYRHLVYWPDSPNLQLIPNLLVYNRMDFPPKKFVIFEHLSKSGHAARGGFLRACAWCFLIWLYALKDWSALAEVFGADIAWAFYKSGDKGSEAAKTQRDILMHLSRIAMKVGVFPEGTDIKVQRATASSGGAPQKDIIGYIEDAFLKLILGSTLGTSAGEKGARSLGQVQQEETYEVVDWTAILTSGTITDGPLRWLMEFNFAEPGDNPKFELPGGDRKDLQALAAVLQILVNVGVQIPERWAHEEFDIPTPMDGEQALKSSGGGAPPQKIFDGESLTGKARSLVGALDGGFSTITEHQAQAALDAVRAQAVREGKDIGAFDKFVGPLKALIARKLPPREALAELDRAAAKMDREQLAGVIEKVMILSDLLGRAVVAEQTGIVEQRRTASANRETQTLTAGFSEDQPRDDHGRWASGGVGEGHVKLRNSRVVKETEKAALVKVQLEEGSHEVWFPKSQSSVDANGTVHASPEIIAAKHDEFDRSDNPDLQGSHIKTGDHDAPRQTFDDAAASERSSRSEAARASAAEKRLAEKPAKEARIRAIQRDNIEKIYIPAAQNELERVKAIPNARSAVDKAQKALDKLKADWSALGQ